MNIMTIMVNSSKKKKINVIIGLATLNNTFFFKCSTPNSKLVECFDRKI